MGSATSMHLYCYDNAGNSSSETDVTVPIPTPDPEPQPEPTPEPPAEQTGEENNGGEGEVTTPPENSGIETGESGGGTGEGA